jgi:SNF2 family DNA or RNA helicase
MGLGKTIQTLALLQKHKEDTEATGQQKHIAGDYAYLAYL